MGDTTAPLSSSLQLQIHLSRSIYRGHEPISCRFMLRNEGPEPLLVNQRMLLDLRLAESEVYFVVLDRMGREHAYQYIVVARPVAADDFKLMGPADELALQYDLRELFGVGKSGAFTVQACYRNRFAHPDPNRRAWVDEVHSNTLEFFTQ